ncbi:MAG: hypothetical protein M1820_001521 [Bogoriella megaspora]|nr:MAG: hypothetical protein M1820_001521 [Bogoriella megaspora]
MIITTVPVRVSLRRSFQRPSLYFHSKPRRLQSSNSHPTSSPTPKDSIRNDSPPADSPSSTTTPSLSPPLQSRILTTILSPFHAYGRTHKRSPYRTQFISLVTIYAIGDISAQNINARGTSQPFSSTYDPFKTLRAMIIGAIASAPAYSWFVYLSSSRFNLMLSTSLLHFLSRWTSKGVSTAAAGSTSQSAQRIYNTTNLLLSTSTRVLLTQLIFTPVFLTFFFTSQSLLTPLVSSSPNPANLPSPPQVLDKLKETVPPAFINSWKLWPAVSAINFAYIPLQYRAIFTGFVMVGWQTYLSILNLRAGRRLQEESRETEAEGREGKVGFAA